MRMVWGVRHVQDRRIANIAPFQDLVPLSSGLGFEDYSELLG
jgi:hypothetical protein